MQEIKRFCSAKSKNFKKIDLPMQKVKKNALLIQKIHLKSQNSTWNLPRRIYPPPQKFPAICSPLPLPWHFCIYMYDQSVIKMI